MGCQSALKLMAALRLLAFPCPAGAEAEEDEGDMSRYGPRPDRLIAKGEGLLAAGRAGAAAAAVGRDGGGGGRDGAADGGGLYRPPKLNPVSMEG